MKVSVVISAYNQSHHFQEALSSALPRTQGDLEMIVVNKGSADGTRAACERDLHP